MLSSVNGVASLGLGAVVVGAAIMMLTSKNVVHAAYWMLATMLGTAGIYLVLSATFVALVQVMVYAGAVAVLLLFVIMLTLRRREDAVRSRDFSWSALVLAALFGAAVLFVLFGLRLRTAPMPVLVPTIEDFGLRLFNTWALPFEIASLVLTVALVGAVWWSGGGRDR